MIKQLLFTLFVVVNLSISGQSFEGSITFQVEALNPNPQLIPDSAWQKGIRETFGERGYMLQKYFYKKGNYISEIDAGKEKGFQAFNPEDGLLYSWQVNSETATTLDSKKSMDEFVEIIESDLTETILGIPCKSIIVKTKMGQMTIWYNSDYFKMDASFYEGHKYGHWEQILNEIGCLPLKIEQKGMMSHIVQLAVEYEETSIPDDKFIIPDFKEINRSPIN
ncbi:hypothetical protein OO013_16690 [Mangrovivirga sp. M17]|uniref:GLPGLI family protein n=1 Tax=Mangrovivirga halotolerans TaxID=2993936 RepID=A0ABT3RUS0_9BACT|nr:hypothetical protein [Mangrovivirga halotolerans]MCX2745520.1 hypothetical protein [Mangrovivirga halotolerans]